MAADRPIDPSGLVVRGERIERDLRDLERFTATPGSGITRLAFSKEDADARRVIMERMMSANLAVRVDAAGNIVGRRPGIKDTGPLVVTGSHIDSVPNGGNYDGPVGVVGAIESVRAMNDAGIRTRLPIEVVCFTCEESARFWHFGHLFGSRAMAGIFPVSSLNSVYDASGVSLGRALSEFGLDPDRVGEACRPPGEIQAFIELHIEQGDNLVRAAKPVGCVTRITGTTRLEVELKGSADHSGGTPMAVRRDALAAAAEVVLAVERIANDLGGSLVATVGVLRVEPGTISVVPGRAVLAIDIRDVVPETKTEALTQIQLAIDSVARKRRIDSAVTVLRDSSPVTMSDRIQGVIESVCADEGIACVRVPSHTGHDTTSLSHIADVGMIFVRNVSKKSHSSSENVDLADIVAGTRVLAGSLVRLARREPIEAA